MSLEMIKYYTDIYTSTNDVNFRDYRTDTIKKIAVAGLIESGIMFSVEQGEIILEGEVEGFQITDIYPYLSHESQQKIIYAGTVKSLPQPQPDVMFTGEGVEDYDSGYEAYDYTPDIPVVNPAKVEQEKKEKEENLVNSKWQDAEKVEPQVQTPQQTPVSQGAVQSPQPVPQETAVKKESVTQPVQTPQAVQSVQSPQSPQPEQSVQPEQSPQQNTVRQPMTTDEELLEISQNAISYEDCTLAIMNMDTGANYRFGMKAYPLTNNLSEDSIIVRCNNLNKNSSFTQTKHGDIVTFDVNDSFVITAARSESDIFEMEYSVKSKTGDEMSFDKINIKTGGQKGNLLITDDNLLIRIYPVNKGPSDKENEPIIYYIYNNGEVTASSSKERKPEFEFDGNRYEIVSRWERGIFKGSVVPVEV